MISPHLAQRRLARAAPRPTRRGVTLLELSLVLAVLILVAAISFPLLEGTLAGSSLRYGADQVRAAWTEARVAAMTTGDIHAFSMEPGSNRFVVERWPGLDHDGFSELATPLDFGHLGLPGEGPPLTDSATARHYQLPDDIEYFAHDTALDNRALDALTTTAAARANPEVPPILFYPDGTASNATLILKNRRDQTIRVDLRGLTGIVTISDIGDFENLP